MFGAWKHDKPQDSFPPIHLMLRREQARFTRTDFFSIFILGSEARHNHTSMKT